MNSFTVFGYVVFFKIIFYSLNLIQLVKREIKIYFQEYLHTVTNITIESSLFSGQGPGVK